MAFLRLRGVAVCLAFALAGAVACVDTLPDNPNDTGDAQAGGDGAAGADASDATQGDDAVASGDGAVDGAAGDAHPAFVFDDPCRPDAGHTFCCDFDDDAGVGCLSSIFTTAGTLTVASSPVLSPPGSLHSKATGASSAAYGRLTANATKGLTCTFDLFVAHDDNQGNAFSLYVNGNDQKGIVALLHPAGAAVQVTLFGPRANDAGADVGPGIVPGELLIPAATWVRFQMDLQAQATLPMVGTLRVLSADAGPPLFIQTSVSIPTKMGASVGLDYVGGGTSDVYLDNVACDFQSF